MDKNIVLLRGLTRERRHWETFPDQLALALTTKSVICIDLPGFGDFFDQTSPATISEIASLTLKNLSQDKRFNKSKKTCLIGLSLGGMVTLEIASRRNDKASDFDGYLSLGDVFSEFIVINSSQKFKTPFYKRFNYKKSADLLKGFLMDSVYEREEKILRLSANSEFNQAVCKRWSSYYDEKPFTLKSALNQFYAGAQFSIKDKPEIENCRGLVLCSKSDRLVDPICSQKISEITGWPIHICSQGGHDLAYDEPEWLCDRIKEFL